MKSNDFNNKAECCNLTEVIHRYYSDLKGYLINQTKDKYLADELVQEIMLKAAIAHSRGVAVENIRAWFFQIARTTLVDHYRKIASDRKFIDSLKIPEEDLNENESNELGQMIDTYLKPMVSLLPAKYAECLILADIDCIPHKEIAAQLQISLSAVRSRVLRARKKLLELIYECCDVETDAQGAFVSCTVKNSCTSLKQ